MQDAANIAQIALWLEPNWPRPTNIRALITTRAGGVSSAPYASFNLGDHVGDDPANVAANRARLRAQLPNEPRWLRQIHGTRVADLDNETKLTPADAAVTRTRGTVAAILTADCLPVLLCADDASVVAAAHAGWRGLCDGVLEAAVAAMRVEPAGVFAYLGPAIGAAAYEVGAEVREAFVARDAQAAHAFAPNARGRWQADLYVLARLRLRAAGVARIDGGDFCTHSERERFFSFRRDGVTGRMASLIWMG
jgi:polyphenol oxidase